MQAILNVILYPYSIAKISANFGYFGYACIMFAVDLPVGIMGTYISNILLASITTELFYSESALLSIAVNGQISIPRLKTLKPARFIKADMPTTWLMKGFNSVLFIMFQVALGLGLWSLLMTVLQLW